MSKLIKWVSLFKKDKNAFALFKGGSVVLAFKVLGALSGYIFAMVVAKRFDAAVYGIFEMAFTFLMITTVVVRLGLDNAIVRFTSEYLVNGHLGKIKALYQKSLWAILLTSLVVGALLYGLKDFFELWFNMAELNFTLIWVVLALVPFAILQFNAEAFRGFKSMVPYAIFQVGSVTLLATFVFLLMPKEAFTPRTQAIVSFFVSAMVLCLFSFLGYTKVLKNKIGHAVKVPVHFKSILKVSLPLLVSSSLFLVMSWTDTLMIGFFKTEADVGIYRIAFKVATLITFTQFAVNSVAAPTIAQHFSANNMEGLRKYINQIGWINLFMALPIFLIIVFFKTQVLNLFGADFTQGQNLLPILAVGQLVNALCGPVMYILNMTGKEKLTRNIMLIMSVVNLMLNTVLIPMYGIMGAAIATSISMIAWNVWAAYWVFKYYKIIAFPWIK